MEYASHKTPPECLCTLSGTFTFSDNGRFREILALVREPDLKKLVLDVSALQFIDSAALGMLLLLHDEATKQQVSITLKGANGQIKKMLQLSNFQEIFTIQYAA